MTILRRPITVLILLCALTWTGIATVQPAGQTITQTVTTPSIPVQTDDGLDPINLIFTGYAPSWWVASNMFGWSDTAYCSGPKTVGGKPYNQTLEHPDALGLPCIGPRDHIRIWDMGYSPILGEWSVASTHHEHTVCDPSCHHVIDSWEKAEADARSSFLNGPATMSVANYTLANAGVYQGVFNDGNATIIQLRPPSSNYPVVFEETGLSNQTSWSVTLNGETTTSQRPAIVFVEPNGTYPYAVTAPSGLDATPSSGTIMVNGGTANEEIHFRVPWTTTSATLNTSGRTVSIKFSGNATVQISSVQLSTGGNTNVAFNATEIGAIGALNVTIPASIAPSGASAIVYVDGTRNDNAKLTSDAKYYYVYFLLPYGRHSVQLQLVRPGTPYLEYFAGGAVAVGLMGALFVGFRLKMKRRRNTTQPVGSTRRLDTNTQA